MEKVKITRYYSSDKNRQGVPYVVKTGRTKGSPYMRVAIQVEGGDAPPSVWLSKNAYNKNDPALSLKEGDEVELKIWQSEEGGFWNFDFPSQEDEIKSQINLLWESVNSLKSDVEELQLGRGENVVGALKKIKEGEPSDLPF